MSAAVATIIAIQLPMAIASCRGIRRNDQFSAIRKETKFPIKKERARIVYHLRFS